MTEQRWQPIIPYLEAFQRHLAPHVPPLRIQHGSDRLWTDERYEEQAKTGIFKQYGVYLIFKENGALEYVGVAMNRFQERIWMHDDYVERRYTDLIPISHAYYFLAPALEFFLLCQLQPPKNKVYCGYTIPTFQADVLPPDANNV